LHSPTIWLRNICQKNGVALDDEQAMLLERFVSLLLEWNQKINLISRRDVDGVWENHILHSISPLFKLTLQGKSRILDLGTGGGLPGIPMKIMAPSLRMTLVDSTQKKVMAVQDMIDKLGLKETDALWGRAEELSKQKALSSQFDYIVSRAVAPLEELVQWCAPFLRRLPGRPEDQEQGSPPLLIAFKGGDLERELIRARRRKEVRSIETLDLVFKGSEELSSIDKKLVLVGFKFNGNEEQNKKGTALV
jgi:16S rRNA (guanine527-N7)-methyltransferase